jgi:hypothetical protein
MLYLFVVKIIILKINTNKLKIPKITQINFYTLVYV